MTADAIGKARIHAGRGARVAYWIGLENRTPSALLSEKNALWTNPWTNRLRFGHENAGARLQPPPARPRRRPSMASNRTGITVVHRRDCATRAAGKKRCTCSPTYRARVRRGGVNVSGNFPTEAAALAWVKETKRRERRGLPVQSDYTVGDALDSFIADLDSGAAKTRSREPFKPGNAIEYQRLIERYLRGAFGGRLVRMRVSDVTTKDIGELRDEIERGDGIEKRSASTVRNAMNPLRVVMRRELENGVIERNPFDGVGMPVSRGTRERIATPQEAAMLLDVLDDRARAFFAVAMYAGLRSGEISALRWEDLDLDRADPAVTVRWSYCSRSGRITPPKSRAAVRTVPIPEVLAGILDEYRARVAADEGAERIAPGALVFVSSRGTPVRGTAVTTRARREWKARDLDPIGLHESRHTYASLMAAAGVRIEDLSEFMGHTSLNLTFKTYRHLYPEARDAARLRLDALLAAG